jgi:hypothetical protein
MASTIPSTSSSEVVRKLIVLKGSRNDYDGDLNGYEWVNKPGLPISVRQLQPETPILRTHSVERASLEMLCISRSGRRRWCRRD